MGVPDEVSAAAQLKLLPDPGTIVLDAFDAHMDLLGNLAVRISLRQPDEYFALARAQYTPRRARGSRMAARLLP